jgi:phosphoribosyl 1,2-cyclic phosphodiesterase
MALQIASLNSGSNGNCYYIGNDTEAVFIDAGLSCRETERRMRVLGLDMRKVKAIFISHEHADHISGMTTLSRKWELPVFITPATHTRTRLPLLPQFTVAFRPNEAVHIGRLSILPFVKHHDGCDPHSFTISCDGVRVGVLTDIGRVCKEVIHHFSQCDAAFLEANYDEVMLEQGRYPYHLKNRIRGGKGHLSNREALELFKQHRPEGMSHLLLSHLSKENNDPQLALDYFRTYAGTTEVVVASRYKPSEVYTIYPRATSKPLIPEKPAAVIAPQLALF